MHLHLSECLPGISKADERISKFFQDRKCIPDKRIILERPVKHLLLRRLNCFFHRHLPGIHKSLKLPNRLRPDRTLCHFVRQIQLIS